MITYEIVKECLDILELNYTDLSEQENDSIGVCFSADDAFPHDIVINILVAHDELLSFVAYADEYHPEGDLLAMANRHNARCHSPRCYIDADGDVIMHRAFILAEEVSPNYIVKDVLNATIFLTIEAFHNFELDNEQYHHRIDENK